MARDYAKRTTSRSPKKAPLPGWLWMLGGLLTGLFVAFLVYLQGQGESPFEGISLPRAKPAATDTRAVTKQPIPKAPPKKEGINFDFYSILPEQEVPWNLGKDGSAVIEGVQFTPIPFVHLALNYQDWVEYAQNGSSKPFLYLNIEIVF